MPAARLMLAQLTQRALQGFELPLVIDLLPLREFQSLQQLFQVVQRVLEILDDFRDVIDRFRDRRSLEFLDGRLWFGTGLRTAWRAFRAVIATMAFFMPARQSGRGGLNGGFRRHELRGFRRGFRDGRFWFGSLADAFLNRFCFRLRSLNITALN